MLFTLNALIIEPSLENKNRLKEALKAVTAFKGAVSVASLEEADLLLQQKAELDVVFFSKRLEQESVGNFIAKLKENFSTRDAACIVMLGNDADSKSIASQLTNGVDGFLMEPYSVDRLQEITRIAEKVKKERREARVKGALGLLVNELMGQVDQLAKLRKSGRPAAISKAVFEDMCSVLPRLEEHEQADYFAIATEKFIAAQVPNDDILNTRSYNGASERVRQRMAKNTIDKVRQAMAA